MQGRGLGFQLPPTHGNCHPQLTFKGGSGPILSNQKVPYFMELKVLLPIYRWEHQGSQVTFLITASRPCATLGETKNKSPLNPPNHPGKQVLE